MPSDTVAARMDIDSVRLTKLHFRKDATSRQHDTSRNMGTLRTAETSWQHLPHDNMPLLGKYRLSNGGSLTEAWHTAERRYLRAVATS